MVQIVSRFRKPLLSILLVPVLVVVIYGYMVTSIGVASVVSGNASAAPLGRTQSEFLYLPFNGDWRVISAFFDHHFPDYRWQHDPEKYAREIACLNGLGFGSTPKIDTFGLEIHRAHGEQIDPADSSIRAYWMGSSWATYFWYDGHDGIDWPIVAGTPISASASGVITFASKKGLLGWTIRIDHENGYETQYSHLLGPSESAPWPGRNGIPAVGQRVNAGDLIAWSGNSSWKFDGSVRPMGAHLHFMVFHNGNVTDPFGWGLPDPLQCYNGETSELLWVGGSPRPFGATSSPPLVFDPTHTEYIGGGLLEGSSDQTLDVARFVSDITLSDGGPALSPGTTVQKTWRVHNSGSTTWTGYRLILTNGDRMEAPNPVDIPLTLPNHEVEITIPIKVPNASSRGDWQIVNRDGTWVPGGHLWVKVTVGTTPTPPPSGQDWSDVRFVNAEFPSVVTPGQQFRPRITVHVQSGQLLQSRGDLLRNTDNNLFGAWPHVAVVGTRNAGQDYTFEFYQNNPITAPSGEGTYTTKWRIWRDGNWAGPEIEIRFDVRNGGGTRPNPPTLQSPGDWYVSRDGSTPQLCTTAMADVQYQFVIYDSAQNADSSWWPNNCWNPPTLGSNGYKWHARVRNSSNGLISDWSEDRHFNIESTVPSIADIRFNPASPSAVDTIWMYACANEQYEVHINTATDGSTNGDWRMIHNALPRGCDPNNSSNWIDWWTLPLEDGLHSLKFIVFKNGQSLVKDDVKYQLNRRRPNSPTLINPSADAPLKSAPVAFSWTPTGRVNTYRLLVSTNPDPTVNPLVDQTFGSTTTIYTTTFASDYPNLYWRVIAANELGSSDSTGHFTIDRVMPVSAVSALPATTYDTAFQVSWSGSDDSSGLRWYDVQVRDVTHPGAAWNDWLNATTISATLYNGMAGHTYCFRSRAMDNASNWEDYPASSAGDMCTKIDPAAAPPAPWWNVAYAGKRNLLIQNNDPLPLFAGYAMQLHFDANTTPSAAELYAASLATLKGDDFRVIYNNATELPRYIQTFQSDKIDIWFQLQAAIGPNPALDNSYQLYYGNAAATHPTTTSYDVLPIPPCDSNTVGLWTFTDGSGTGISDACNRHPGSTTNGTWSAGLFAQSSLHFNGSNSTVSIPDSSEFNLPAFTIEAYVNRGYNGHGAQQLVRREHPAQTGNQFVLGFGEDVLEVEAYCFGFAGTTKVGGGFHTPLGGWTHVALTFDGNTLSTYVNGQLDRAVPYTHPACASYNSGVGPLMMGNNRVNSDWYIGDAQYIRISNVVRSSFPYAAFLNIKNSPSVVAGALSTPPVLGTPDLALQSFSTYPYPEGGALVQAVVKNVGTQSTQSGFLTDLYLGHVPTGIGDYAGSVQFWVNDSIAAGSTVTLTTVITSLPQDGVLSRQTVGPIVETSGTLYGQVDSAGGVSETNKANNIYSTGTEVCVASVDAYEPDDSGAIAIPLAIGHTQLHNVSGPSDQDWVSFSAQGGITYSIQTTNLSVAADTYLYLFGPDGTTLLASNDDYGGSLASRVDWAASITGTYYVLVKHWNPNAGGCGTTYQFMVTKPGAFKIYLPIVLKSSTYVPPTTPTPTGTPTKTPTPTATPTKTATPTATSTSTPVPACSTWNLIGDWRLSPIQENPSRDGCGNVGVWHYMYSTSLTRDPQTYITLPVFMPNAWGIPGLEQWSTNPITVPDTFPPLVGLNSTNSTWSNGLNSWPPHTVRVHPMPTQLSVVGWRSSIAATVAITGLVSDDNPGCGDGILWYIDKGSTNIANGSFGDGGAQTFSAGSGGSNLANVAVSPGDFIYFVIHPNASHGCDSTRLDIAIHTVSANHAQRR